MNYKVLEARHLSEKRRAERERDEARAQRDELAEYVRAAIRAGCFTDTYAQLAADALAGLEEE